MDIYIIGGGASGVLCAIEASKKLNNKVHIIEKNDKLMKKLLITGNGCCNFTNVKINNKNYYTNNILKIYDNSFVLDILNEFDGEDLYKYLYNLGIFYASREKYNEQYFYPKDFSSRSVYFCLMDVLKYNNVDIIYNTEVLDIIKNNEKYEIFTNNNKYIADKIVISTGGKSYKKTGSDGKMFDILENMGVKIKKPIPVLCPLIHNDKKLKNLKGIRAECLIKTFANSINIHKEYGEVQFNDNNISGISIFNSSLFISQYIKDKIPSYISLDFIPEIDDINVLYARRENIFYRHIKDFLCGVIDNKIAEIIFEIAKIRYNSDLLVEDISNKEMFNIYNLLKSFVINIEGVGDFETAQATKGGVDIEEINNNSFMLKKYKNIYVTGEALDIVGICGGFNLSFAFISGILAGKHIDNN